MENRDRWQNTNHHVSSESRLSSALSALIRRTRTLPARRVEGIARFVGEANGRNRLQRVHLCHQLSMRRADMPWISAMRPLNIAHMGSSYAFTYLEQPVGNAFTGVSLRVIAISEPDSGPIALRAGSDQSSLPNRRSIFSTPHCWSAPVFLADSSIAVSITDMQKRALIGSRRKKRSRKGAGPISLGLESKEAELTAYLSQRCKRVR